MEPETYGRREGTFTLSKIRSPMMQSRPSASSSTGAQGAVPGQKEGYASSAPGRGPQPDGVGCLFSHAVALCAHTI